MKSTHILFEEPENYNQDNRFPYFGASPKFISFLREYLIKYLGEIKLINLALYLFNNYELHKLFRELAEKGVLINVISIPLEGYDNSSPQNITNEDGSVALKNKHTKHSLASNIYQNFLDKPLHNYQLYIFSHTYIRSQRIKSFSRGQMPYSLHIKSMLIEFKTAEIVSCLTSSNLAMRDMVKHDTFILKEVEGKEAQSTKDFFNHLLDASVPINDFQPNKSGVWNYCIKPQEQLQTENLLFTAPFYTNSGENAEKQIVGLMKTAKKRIWIVAQHISAFNYSVPLNFKVSKQTNAQRKVPGLLYTLLEKGKTGVEVVCLSQTYTDDSRNKLNCRKPVNTFNFVNFIKEYKKLPEAKYFVNDSIHSKFIIVDDMVIVSTFNYTPTQFIYLPKVKIDNFEHIKDLKYEGIFSEVGQSMLLTKNKDVECFKKNFQYILNNPKTIQVI